MEFTRIGKNNLKYFSPMVFDTGGENSNRLLRVGAMEDGKICGAFSIRLDPDMNSAIIESLYVVEEYRRQGRGTAMIREVERLVSEEVDSVEAVFHSDVDGMTELFRSCGYGNFHSDSFYEYDVANILSLSNISKSIMKIYQSVNTITFSNLLQRQKNAVFNLIYKHGERINEEDTMVYNPDLSVAIFDKEDKNIPRACIIGGSDDDNKIVTITYFLAEGESDPRYMLSAAVGFFKTALREGGGERFEKFRAQMTNPHIEILIKKMFSNAEPARKINIVEMIKVI
ncbi:MAG: GNAT family N-acetyltransferase [Lachnospiraceae bacterium]|nr:GNAT family N-acetyltransferase [Lachnospiraceae bacterium]